MTDAEILKAYEEMAQEWENKLPNPEQEPRRFAYYVKMYKFFKERNTDANHTTNS